ncbi:MAG: hypothetical protein NZ890_12185 [Myxococcota bacterium]|nr:hypothetical protein [Myxococcota bacterium]
MLPVRWLPAAALLLALTPAALAQRGGLPGRPASPSGKHCLDEPHTKLLVNHTLVGSINPLGLENQLRFSVCTPLVRRPGLLFMLTYVEAGLANYISPTHIHLGPFLSISPLSILTLRAEVTGMFIWPLALPGAGYIPLDGYEPFTDQTLEPPLEGPDAGRRAYGVRSLLGATLQAGLPVGRGVTLAVVDAFGAEWWRVLPVDPFEGRDRPFYYLARRDVTARADGDWILANMALLLAMVEFKGNYVLRLGALDDLVVVPASGYIGNLVGGLVAIMVRRISTLARNLQLFLRLGGYTDHAFRGGVAVAGGLDIYYEVFKR